MLTSRTILDCETSLLFFAKKNSKNLEASFLFGMFFLLFPKKNLKSVLPIRVASLFKKEGIFRWTVLGGGTLPEKIFRCKKFSEMPKKNRASGPKIRGVQKSKKRVVFWHKKCENFRTRHPIFFSQKKFNPPRRPKRHFALKDTFPMETIVNKKTAKIPKISKILLSYFSKKKSKKKIYKKNSRRRRRLFFFSIGK